MKSHYIQKHDKNGIRMKETIACRHHTCVIPLSSSFSSHLQKKTPLSQPAHPPSLLLASSFFKLSPSAQSHYSTHFSSPVSALSRRTSHLCISLIFSFNWLSSSSNSLWLQNGLPLFSPQAFLSAQSPFCLEQPAALKYSKPPPCTCHSLIPPSAH